jgi:hypothetical protein
MILGFHESEFASYLLNLLHVDIEISHDTTKSSRPYGDGQFPRIPMETIPSADGEFILVKQRGTLGLIDRVAELHNGHIIGV